MICHLALSIWQEFKTGNREGNILFETNCRGISGLTKKWHMPLNSNKGILQLYIDSFLSV